MQMVYYMLHTQPFLFMRVIWHLCHNIILNMLWHLVAHQHLFMLIFHFISFFTFIFQTAFFHCLSPYFPNFHILLHYFFLLFNNNLFIVIFYIIFLGIFTGDGFTCFIDAIIYFLSIAEHVVTIISLELSVLYLNNFF